MEGENTSLVKKQENDKTLVIKLGNTTEEINLDGLTESQIQELKYKYAAETIDLRLKSNEAGIAVNTLDNTLDSLNKKVDDATQAGHSSTIEHTISSELGKTSVVIGNTERAARGEKDRTLLYAVMIGIAIIAVLILSR
jgi:hypothetical protein